jgi:hypothetical protein
VNIPRRQGTEQNKKNKTSKIGIWGIKRKLMRSISVKIHLVVKPKNGNMREVIKSGE